MRQGMGRGLWFPRGISNNETDLLIRMSIQSFSSSDPWGLGAGLEVQLWWAKGGN